MRRPTVTWATMIVLVAAVLGGCQGGKENGMDVRERAEAKAVETRGHVDDLVERLGGSGVKVVGDDIIDCDPQDPDAGLVHNYTVRFTVEDDAAGRLQGEIADALEADGWTVRRDAPNPDRGVVSVRFLRDSFSMGSKIADSGMATAGGSSGCVS
jgi:hypothetical protein